MQENIKYYPVNYQMSPTLKNFFTCITQSKELQKKLYHTLTLADVSDIAKQMGFEISPSEVLQSQAGRVLAIINEQTNDVEKLISGEKPKTGAQWGRGGNGYLDKAGYWLITLRSEWPIYPENKQIDELFIKLSINNRLSNQILSAKTIKKIVSLLHDHSISIDPIELLAYQAYVILSLDEKLANQVAS